MSLINSLKFGNSTYGITLPYGTCATAAGTATKEVTLPTGEYFDQAAGARISVKFNAAPGDSGGSAFQLKVGSNAAAKIYSQGIELHSSNYYWYAGQVVDFVFDGTNWNMIGAQQDTNTDTNTAHKHSAGVGLIGSGNDGINSGTYTYKAALVNETKGPIASTYYTGMVNVTEKVYAVSLDKDGKLAVYVPWIDTTYSAAGSSLGLVKSGGDVTISSGIISVTDDSHNHSASTITGTLNTSHIPDLAASKITSGTFDAARIPSLAASKITSGTFNAARIPNLDASKITSGTIDAARLPSYVDDVLEGTYHINGIIAGGEPAFVLTGQSTAVTPESGKVYVDINSNKTYRWSGTQFTLIASDLALGTTASTAAAGNHTHTLSITNTSDVAVSSLAHNTQYYLTAGGNKISFTLPSDANTLTSAGTTKKADTKLFLVGATSNSSSSATTYSNSKVYIGADNCLYSNDTKVSVEGHTHSYAGSSSVGGSANSAVKLDSNAGSATQPVYFSGGKPVACTYYVNKTVPADAVFTDTTYGIATDSKAGLVKPISVITKPTINSASTTSGKYYPVQMSSDGNMFVNVPWENTTYNGASATTNGLMTSGYYNYMVGHTHSGSKKYTPTGTVSKPTFSGSGGTTDAVTTSSYYTSIAPVTNVGTLPSLSVSVSNKCLTFSWSAGTTPTLGTAVDVTLKAHKHGFTPAGTVSQPTFTGTESTISITTGAGANP